MKIDISGGYEVQSRQDFAWKAGFAVGQNVKNLKGENISIHDRYEIPKWVIKEGLVKEFSEGVLFSNCI